MSLGELFASIRERRRRSVQQRYEEGAQIRSRLQELLFIFLHRRRSHSPSLTALLETTRCACRADDAEKAA